MSVSTDLGLSYELDIDINLAGPGVTPENWQQIRFTSAIAPSIDPTLIDVATYDDEGAANQERVGESWTLPFTIQVRRNTDGTFLPEVQALLAAAAPGVRGTAAQVEIRFYDSEGAAYAFQGVAVVKVDRGNTGNAEAGSWSVTLTGKGKLHVIANPGQPSPTAKPVVTAVTPPAAAAGAQITIKGGGFTDATAVKVGATAATSYVVVGDSTVIAIVPAGSAGSAAITVTNAIGVSAGFPYTRGA